MLSIKLAVNIYSNQWKSFVRNKRWRRNIPGQVFTGLTFLLLVFSFLFIGRYISQVLHEAGGEPVGRFNSLLLWYFAVDLVLRSTLQPLPTLQVLPFMRLPVSRSRLIRWLLLRSLWNVFNFLPFLVVLPFVISILLPGHGGWAGCFYLVGILLLVLLNNYLAVLIGFLAKGNALYLLIPALLFAALYYANDRLFSVRATSETLGRLLIQGSPALFLSIPAAIGILVKTAQLVLSPRLYIDQMTPAKNWNFRSVIMGLDTFSAAGEIKRNIWLELNLLLRNKRPRQLLGPTQLLLVIYLIYVSATKELPPIMYLLNISLMSAFLPLQYGQFVFSWESSYFDGIMSRKGDLERYVRSKYYLMILQALIGFLPLVVLLFASPKADIFLLLAFFSFTCGVTIPFLLFAATFNDGRIDLDRTQYFTYQAVKGTQLITVFAFVLIPIGLFELFQHWCGGVGGRISVAAPGIAGILLNRRLIGGIIVPQFRKRKYKNLEGYRKLFI
jgi:hypothetical protein